MLKGINAKIGITLIAILVLCGSAIGIINAFADPNYAILSVEDDLEDWDNIVDLDGTNSYEFKLSILVADNYYITRNISGSFNVSNPYITPIGCNKGLNESICDISTGQFSLEYNGSNPLGNLFAMRYTISPDTPAGVYDLSLDIDSFRAQADDDGFEEPYYIDLGEVTPYTYFELTVRRPQEIVFTDSNNNPITEITKYLGDEDFIVNKNTISGEGDISDYYIDYESEEGVVEVTPDSDYIQVLKVGTARICAWASEAGLYTNGESCFTVNVEKKPILTHSVYVLDEEFDATGPAVVELDNDEDVEVSVYLKPTDTIRILNLEGRFVPYNDYDVEPTPVRYIRATSIWAPFTTGCELDRDYGFFECEYDSIDADGNWAEVNVGMVMMSYTVSRDTPAGVYTLPIYVNRIQGHNVDDDTDFDEEMITLNVQILVKRPQRVVFWDENDMPFTEINKTFGDSDFIVTKAVYEPGDGSIIDYYINSETEDGVVSIIPDSDYIRVLKAGTARICASISETELYLASESCFTINVEPREIWVKKLTVADKQYDGNNSVEIDELLFYTLDTDGLPVDLDLDSTEYEVWGPSVDDPNVGERTATVEIYLNGETNKYYNLAEHTYTVPVTISPIPLQNMSATVSSKEYDGGTQFPAVTPVVGTSDSGEVRLEEGEDFEISYNGGDVYVDGNFVEVGDYRITVYPKEGGIYTFEPFEVTYTITPKIISVSYAEVNDKEYDRTPNATLQSISFSDVQLTEGVDYDAYASFNSSDAGTRNATVYVTLYNQNYSFYYDDLLGRYIYQDTYGVYSAEIFPKTLTNDNTYYDLENSHNYTGEEIKPFISLSITFVDGEQPEDPLTIGQDYTIEYPNDTINAGLKSATISGKGNFRGSIGPIEYFISSSSVQDVQVTTPSRTYSGEPLEPEPVITAIFNDNRITMSTRDYVILDHEDFVNVGDHTYIIQESNAGNYHFSNTEVTFTVAPYEISSSNISLSQDIFKHNGTSQTPSVTVTVGETIVDENDYDVEFSADTVGNDEGDTEVTVTITAKDGANITGSASTTYVITPRDVLTITGVDDNQRIGYTGSPVVLSGNVMVEENEEGITADDLTITWYASDGTTVIDQPTNAGSYKVVYSYGDADYYGVLAVNFEITKAESPVPAEMETDFRIASGQTLADLEGERTTGFAWVDSSTTIISGNNVYPATYTYNNDTINYETLNLNVPVYGLSQIDVNVPESEGGEITISNQNVLEGETVTITITPDFGYILDSITVNGVDYTDSVDANTLTIVAGTSDLEIIATFSPIVYEVVEGAEQVYTIGEDNEAKFKINASYELFENGGAVYVDDVLVDPENYTSWDGSTYVQLAKKYLDTLAVGTHTLKVVFNDGGTATTTFTIANSNVANDGEDSNGISTTPGTGFSTIVNGGGATATISLSVVIMAAFAVMRKMRKNRR